MLFLLHIGTLHLLRAWRTTAVLSALIFAAVATLVVIHALAVGTTDAMVENSVGLYSGHITASKIPAGSLLEKQISPAIKGILIRRHQEVLFWHGDTTVAGTLTGVQAAAEQRLTALPVKIIAGRYLDDDTPGVVLSQEMATRLAVAPGDRIDVGRQPGHSERQITVAGIYHTGIARLDQQLFFTQHDSYPFLSERGSVAIFVPPEVPLANALMESKLLLPELTLHGWPDFLPDLYQLVELNTVCLGILTVLVFFLVAIGITGALLVFTLNSRREHGILKALGLRPAETAVLLVWQSLLMSLTASLLGILAGALLVTAFTGSGIDLTQFTSHNQYFSVSGIIHPRLTATGLLAPPLLAVLFSLAATIWPLVYILRRPPAQILRSL